MRPPAVSSLKGFQQLFYPGEVEGAVQEVEEKVQN